MQTPFENIIVIKSLFNSAVTKNEFMKKKFLYIILTIALGSSCKKQPPAPLSQWIFDGATFKGYARTSVGGFGANINYGLRGLEDGNNYVWINFHNYIATPSTSVVFKVKRRATDSSECTVTVGVSGNSLLEYSSEDSNSEVTITVSPSGKLSASFAGIVLKNFYGTETKTVSGTLVEQNLF